MKVSIRLFLIFLLSAFNACGPKTKKYNAFGPNETDQNVEKPSANQLCRFDLEDESEYCYDPDKEMPSDIDPRNKVQKCSFGILDDEICQPVTIIQTHDYRSILAGEKERMRISRIQTYLSPVMYTRPKTIMQDRLVLSEKENSASQLIQYDYKTKFPTPPKNSLGSVEIGPFLVKHPVADFHIAIQYKGFAFETGLHSLEKFNSICAALYEIDKYPTDSYGWKISHGDSSLKCTDGYDLYVNCTTIGTNQCFIDEMYL